LSPPPSTSSAASFSDGRFPSAQEREHQQRQADKQENINELASAVHTKRTDQPCDEQGERNLEEHVASAAATRTEDRWAGCAVEVGEVEEAMKTRPGRYRWRGPVHPDSTVA
jgi:hypothetical protein